MPISKPYFNICRPPAEGAKYTGDYVLDPQYIQGRQNAVQAYHLLESNLMKIFRYIEPGDANLRVFSHELYQLYVRACIEFESHAKAVLKRNGYSRTGMWNIKDYYKIEEACKLSNYRVRLPVWRNGSATSERTPFSQWKPPSHSLSLPAWQDNVNSIPWYQGYNSVKHNRSDEFEKANLDNVLHAVSSVLVILFAQIDHYAFGVYRPALQYRVEESWILPIDGLIEIRPPETWSDAETYDFRWSDLESDPNRFQQFPFRP